MARNRSRNKPRSTLSQDVTALEVALKQLVAPIVATLEKLLGPTNQEAETPTTCRVGELSVDHLGRWIIVSRSPSPRDSTAGCLVGLSPGQDRAENLHPTRGLLLQQGPSLVELEVPTNIIALIAPRDWR